jgi:hypothetical protein
VHNIFLKMLLDQNMRGVDSTKVEAIKVEVKVGAVCDSFDPDLGDEHTLSITVRPSSICFECSSEL